MNPLALIWIILKREIINITALRIRTSSPSAYVNWMTARLSRSYRLRREYPSSAGSQVPREGNVPANEADSQEIPQIRIRVLLLLLKVSLIGFRIRNRWIMISFFRFLRHRSPADEEKQGNLSGIIRHELKFGLKVIPQIKRWKCQTQIWSVTHGRPFKVRSAHVEFHLAQRSGPPVSTQADHLIIQCHQASTPCPLTWVAWALTHLACRTHPT